LEIYVLNLHSHFFSIFSSGMVHLKVTTVSFKGCDATVLICMCSLLCNNIPIAAHTRNSTVPSLLWYGLVNSAQQRTAFSNDLTRVLYRVRLKTFNRHMEDASVPCPLVREGASQK
jgi:hypothetical protein